MAITAKRKAKGEEPDAAPADLLRYYREMLCS